jgi:hypothetical protein
VNNHLREQLLGYLLDALEDDERQQIEQQLEDDPSLIDELQTLRTSLQPLAENYEDFEPPSGLARRACSRVDQRRQLEPVGPAGGALNTTNSGASASRSRISVADVVVTAGIVLAAVLIFFPAIASSRYASRLTHCQDNLRQLGLALVNYSDKLGGGFFPAVASQGNRAFAGVYGPTLIDSGYLDDANNLICPSSALAEQPPAYRVPTLEEIDRATPQAIIMIRRYAGGSYGYTLGVIVQGAHVAPRNQGRANFGLMADAPSTSWKDNRSTSHAGRGQNILFEDGHFRFVEINAINAPWLDNPFRNRHGIVEAGVDEDDAVIAPSFTPPFILNVSSRLED